MQLEEYFEFEKFDTTLMDVSRPQHSPGRYPEQDS